MNLISSYAVQLTHVDFDLKPTIHIYRTALSYCIDVVNNEWSNVITVKSAKEKVNFVEHLIHSTKDNVAKYDFDNRFYKMPSYLRRAVIQSAIGSVSSYKSSLENWNKNHNGKEPTLALDRYAMPVFYNKNMYLTSDNPYEGYLKVYFNNDWVWRKVSLLPTDVKYLQKHLSHLTPSAPVLEKRFGTYYLRFAFEENVQLYNTPIRNQTICAVDLGLNTDAVCSIMTADGTIHARKFINFASDKDHLLHVVNRIKKQQRKHGNKSIKSRWRYAKHINEQLSVKIATAIVDFAELYNADVVVFEYLDIKGKVRTCKAQMLQLWRKNEIQNIATHKTHKRHMRVSHICAWGTSKLAFDGSGNVIRDKNNYALATFTNGKQYNCDLSASYNIGSRYFIRELLKPYSATDRSQLWAKVPTAKRRTTCTYTTLVAFHKAEIELGFI